MRPSALFGELRISIWRFEAKSLGDLRIFKGIRVEKCEVVAKVRVEKCKALAKVRVEKCEYSLKVRAEKCIMRNITN